MVVMIRKRKRLMVNMMMLRMMLLHLFKKRSIFHLKLQITFPLNLIKRRSLSKMTNSSCRKMSYHYKKKIPSLTLMISPSKIINSKMS